MDLKINLNKDVKIYIWNFKVLPFCQRARDFALGENLLKIVLEMVVELELELQVIVEL